MPADQFELFAEAPAPTAYVPDALHVRNRLGDMLEQMQGAASWPWPAVTVRLYRETVWPYLLDLLPDPAEAADWRSQIEAQAARLDGAA
mgnify:CR=1 FL=1